MCNWINLIRNSRHAVQRFGTSALSNRSFWGDSQDYLLLLYPAALPVEDNQFQAPTQACSRPQIIVYLHTVRIKEKGHFLVTARLILSPSPQLIPSYNQPFVTSASSSPSASISASMKICIALLVVAVAAKAFVALEII